MFAKLKVSQRGRGKDPPCPSSGFEASWIEGSSGKRSSVWSTLMHFGQNQMIHPWFGWNTRRDGAISRALMREHRCFYHRRPKYFGLPRFGLCQNFAISQEYCRLVYPRSAHLLLYRQRGMNQLRLLLLFLFINNVVGGDVAEQERFRADQEYGGCIRSSDPHHGESQSKSYTRMPRRFGRSTYLHRVSFFSSVRLVWLYCLVSGCGLWVTLEYYYLQGLFIRKYGHFL